MGTAGIQLRYDSNSEIEWRVRKSKEFNLTHFATYSPGHEWEQPRSFADRSLEAIKQELRNLHRKCHNAKRLGWEPEFIMLDQEQFLRPEDAKVQQEWVRWHLQIVRVIQLYWPDANIAWYNSSNKFLVPEPTEVNYKWSNSSTSLYFPFDAHANYREFIKAFQQANSWSQPGQNQMETGAFLSLGSGYDPRGIPRGEKVPWNWLEKDEDHKLALETSQQVCQWIGYENSQGRNGWEWDCLDWVYLYPTPYDTRGTRFQDHWNLFVKHVLKK